MIADLPINVENKAVNLPGGSAGVERAVSNIIGTFTIFGGILMIIYLAFGALMYITSGGDKDQLSKARKSITNAVIGLVVIVLVVSIAAIMGTVLGIDIINPPWVE